MAIFTYEIENCIVTIQKPDDVDVIPEVTPDYNQPLATGRRKVIRVVMTTADGGTIIQPTKD